PNGAFDLFLESHAKFKQMQDTWGIALAHVNLGRVMRRCGYLQEATDHHLEAIQILASTRLTWLMADNLVEVAMLFYESKEMQRSIEILDFVLQYPASTPQSLQRAQNYQQQIISRHAELALASSSHISLQTDIKALNVLVAAQLAKL
ncbi:MAG: hypothetical protein H0X30_37625, partial [Anaerolineae bacterium]|nr:hypothetical protein [Anaerolineae bacterium]